MDFLALMQAIVLGVVEGLTEFLPVSSTGHLILAGSLLNFVGEKAKLFEIVIQGAAILAVCFEFRIRIKQTLSGIKHPGPARNLMVNLGIAFLPLAILGLLFKHPIEEYLFRPVPVALALVLGGIFILWAERRIEQGAMPVLVERLEDLTAKDALKLGLAQALALIPGTSRSGATIIGGLFFGLSRRCATEFSFFLAIPTLILATLYQLWKERALLSMDDLGLWLVGSFSAFLSALVCVRWLLRYISSHDFRIFAWYRIAFGGLVLASAWGGWLDWPI